MKIKQIHMVVDLQYGSTGKGLLIGYLAKKLKPDTIVTAWAANAGHTFIDDTGRKFVHTMLANGVVSPNIKRVLLGAGSVIDPDNLAKEYEECRDLLQTTKIAIHPHAAIISQRHRDEEAGPMTKIGSTKKGVGAAAIQRIRRDPDDMNVAKFSDHPFIKNHVVTVEKYQSLLDESEVILVEGAQGYALSMYHGFYPFTTSRDVTPHQILADCCIPMNFGTMTTYGTVRTYPIRVANRFDEQGKQIGYSGPCYPDQKEITWEDLGIKPELTTVTKLPRRVFTFSETQYKEAVRMCGIDVVFVNFANYMKTQAEAYEFCKRLASMSPAQVRYVGIGATENDVRKVDLTSFSTLQALDGFKTSLHTWGK
jgi:adenylosuccinate synthase